MEQVRGKTFASDVSPQEFLCNFPAYYENATVTRENGMQSRYLRPDAASAWRVRTSMVHSFCGTTWRP